MSSLSFIRLFKKKTPKKPHLEDSNENALTSVDIIMRMNGNLNINTLGKEIKKLFKHVQVKGIRTKEDWTKREPYNGIFGKQMQPSSYHLQIF